MAKVWNRFQRAMAHRRLHRGRCAHCGWVLRDDARSRFCSTGCQADWYAYACSDPTLSML